MNPTQLRMWALEKLAIALRDQVTGWLTTMMELTVLTPSEIDDLIWLDEVLTRPAQAVAAFERSLERDVRWGLIGAEDPLSHLSTQISDMKCVYGEMVKRDASAVERQMFLLWAELPAKEALCARLSRDLTTPRIPGKVTEDQIERARNFPIADLIGVKNGAYVKCPFCPSERFWAKGSIGHCFSCNKTANSLRYMMLTRQIAFIEAVRALQA